MVYLKKLFEKIKHVITWPYRKYQERKLLKQKLKELKERDPFIYK